MQYPLTDLLIYPGLLYNCSLLICIAIQIPKLINLASCESYACLNHTYCKQRKAKPTIIAKTMLWHFRSKIRSSCQWQNSITVIENDGTNHTLKQTRGGARVGEWAYLTSQSSHQTVPLFFLPNTKAGIVLHIGWHRAVSNAKGAHFPSTIYCSRLIYELFQAVVIICSEEGGLDLTTTRVWSPLLSDEM